MFVAFAKLYFEWTITFDSSHQRQLIKKTYRHRETPIFPCTSRLLHQQKIPILWHLQLITPPQPPSFTRSKTLDRNLVLATCILYIQRRDYAAHSRSNKSLDDRFARSLYNTGYVFFVALHRKRWRASKLFRLSGKVIFVFWRDA